MDPFLKLWMFENWIEDQHEESERNKYLSLSIGQFSNPEAVREIMNRENNSYVSTDEEFDELSNRIAAASRKQLEEKKELSPRRRRRRVVKDS